MEPILKWGVSHPLVTLYAKSLREYESGFGDSDPTGPKNELLKQGFLARSADIGHRKAVRQSKRVLLGIILSQYPGVFCLLSLNYRVFPKTRVSNPVF